MLIFNALTEQAKQTMPQTTLLPQAKYVRIARHDVELPARTRTGEDLRPWPSAKRNRLLDARQISPQGSTQAGEVVPVTQTRTFLSAVTPIQAPTTLPTLSILTHATANATQTSESISPSSSPTTTTSSAPATTSHNITPAKPVPFPTALVASLASLVPLALLITLYFYLYYRKRSPDRPARLTSPSMTFHRGGGDKYVWGPLGLIRRHERDKENPVLKAQESEARVDPIAEAIRQEEKERLARQRRSGDAKFYAPGVRHLVEYIGSKEQMKVVIDWRDRLKFDRPW